MQKPQSILELALLVTFATIAFSVLVFAPTCESHNRNNNENNDDDKNTWSTPVMRSIDEEPAFREWAVVEVMGHQRFAGLVTEQTIGGASFIRVDVPAIGEDQPAFTKILGASSIFAITPCDEASARAIAESFRSRPVSQFILPAPDDDDDAFDDAEYEESF